MNEASVCVICHIRREMMFDPGSITVGAVAKVSIGVAQQIYKQAQAVKYNKAQCKRLSERVKTIIVSVNALVEKLPKQAKQLGGGSDGATVHTTALLSLNNTLDAVLKLLKNFSQKNVLDKVVLARAHNTKFDEIYTRLDEDIKQLNLGLNAKQVLNREEDKLDQQKDFQDLMANQVEILKEARAAKGAMQKIMADGKHREEVLTKQLESMQYALAQLHPDNKGAKSKKAEISSKLLVPFFDLQIDKVLAEGSFAKVYLGRFREQDVAIKLLDGDLTEIERHEFVREVRIMQGLRSDYVVPLYAVCDEPGRMCMIMKYMAQGSLRTVLDSQAPLSAKQRHQMALDVALGLYYLHKEGIWHRDLKSGNVLIDSEGRARLTDFGLSKSHSAVVKTIDKQTEAMEWMAPEILASGGDKRMFTAEADVYSFGMVLWEIMTGQTPYAGCDDADIVLRVKQGQHDAIPETVPVVYRELIEGCWQASKYNRPSLPDIIGQLRVYTPPAPAALVPPSANPVGFFAAPPSSGSSSSSGAISQAQLEGLYDAAGVCEQAKQYDKAAVCYELAANQGHVKAKTGLGCCTCKVGLREPIRARRIRYCLKPPKGAILGRCRMWPGSLRRGMGLRLI